MKIILDGLDFPCAIRALKVGRMIKRKEGTMIFHITDLSKSEMITHDMTTGEEVVSANFNQEDILGVDWQVVFIE